MKKGRILILMFVALMFGVVLGGYLFSDSRPRAILALNNCDGTCLHSNELLGLAASVGLQRFSSLAPSVVKETNKTIVIDHPGPQEHLHYLIIPKKDMKNIADVSDADMEYVVDAMRVAREIVREKNLVDYRLTTNGPGYQTATYLHFHLTAN